MWAEPTTPGQPAGLRRHRRPVRSASSKRACSLCARAAARSRRASSRVSGSKRTGRPVKIGTSLATLRGSLSSRTAWLRALASTACAYCKVRGARVWPQQAPMAQQRGTRSLFLLDGLRAASLPRAQHRQVLRRFVSQVRTSFGVSRANFLRPRNGVMCWSR